MCDGRRQRRARRRKGCEGLDFSGYLKWKPAGALDGSCFVIKWVCVASLITLGATRRRQGTGPMPGVPRINPSKMCPGQPGAGSSSGVGYCLRRLSSTRHQPGSRGQNADCRRAIRDLPRSYLERTNRPAGRSETARGQRRILDLVLPTAPRPCRAAAGSPAAVHDAIAPGFDHNTRRAKTPAECPGHATTSRTTTSIGI